MNSADDCENLELIESLIVQMHERSISPQDVQRLNDLLLGSRKGRQLFLQHAQMEAVLHWIYAAREQVATVIDGVTSNAARPIADVARQQLRFSDDGRFIQVSTACAANEAHSQEWLQIFPRILAVTSLCASAGGGAGEPIQACVDKLLAKYSPEDSISEFWQAAYQATRDVLQHAVAGNADAQAVAEALQTCAFDSPETNSLLDAILIHEILDDCIPHRLPADTLRVLCLRYLNGLSVDRIALHLNRSAQEVQSHLAKVRIHLLSRCLAGAGVDLKQLNVGGLLHWSTVFDAPGNGSFLRLSRAVRAENDAFNPAHLLLLGMVHDYLGRQLSATRLLEEVPAQKDKSYLLAIEQSLRDIEALGTTQPAQSGPVSPGGFSRRSLQLAALLGVAAGMLIAVGISMLSGPRDGAHLANVPPSAEELVAPPKVATNAPAVEASPAEPTPPMAPVAAVVSEALDMSPEDRRRFPAGAEMRVEYDIVFDAGVLELTTKSGSVLVLEGPVDASISGLNRVSLRQGKIAGLNQTEGESLVIDSPTTSIIDVGTEFGVAVDERQETLVAVYDGEVRLELVGAPSTPAASEAIALHAGWETIIDAAAGSPSPAVALSHDREFVRADEVQLRKHAADGNLDSAAEVAFFNLLRIKDLLCYQGFQAASDGAQRSIGFRNPVIRRDGDATFGPNVSPHRGRLGDSNSLQMGKDATCFLDIDVTTPSRLARAGLVGQNSVIGGGPGELWLYWRTQAIGPPEAEFSWAGLSLMFGDKRSTDEPLFVGLPAPLDHLGIHTFPGQGEPNEVAKALSREGALPGDQAPPPDSAKHAWLIRLEMNGASADVAVWCDVDPGKVAAVPPGAVQRIEGFRFDRIRLEAHPAGGEGHWLFDDVMIASNSDAIASALQVIYPDAASTASGRAPE